MHSQRGRWERGKSQELKAESFVFKMATDHYL